MIILKMAELYTARTAKNYATYICVVSPTTSTCRGRRTSTGAAVVVYEGSAESEAVRSNRAHKVRLSQVEPDRRRVDGRRGVQLDGVGGRRSLQQRS